MTEDSVIDVEVGIRVVMVSCLELFSLSKKEMLFATVMEGELGQLRHTLPKP